MRGLLTEKTRGKTDIEVLNYYLSSNNYILFSEKPITSYCGYRFRTVVSRDMYGKDSIFFMMDDFRTCSQKELEHIVYEKRFISKTVKIVRVNIDSTQRVMFWSSDDTGYWRNVITGL